ncbi:MAG: nucleoid-associated protein [Anaerolineae bacterium]|nr:nucleoid-associated protein [Anaerolineae bacterium]
MRFLHNVEVTDAIVHILELKEGKKLISERKIPLENNTDIKEYFAELIAGSTESDGARAALFSGTGATKNASLKLCEKMFSGGAGFTAGSKILGDKFYDLMKNDGRIGDGDLVACRFKADAKSGGDFLCIMKLNPVGVFRNVQRGKAGSGEMYIDLEIDTFVFPRDNKNVVQKIAIINDKTSNALLLDRQQFKKGEVAQFFKDFLELEFLKDPAELTLLLYQCLIKTLNELRKNLQPQQDMELGRQIYEIFTENGIKNLTRIGKLNLREWAEKLKVPQLVRNRFVQDLQDEFDEVTEIQIDLSLVQEYTRKRSFSGEFSSHFSIPTESYGAVVQSVEYVRGKPGEQDHYRVVINTSNWREEVK